MIFEDEIFYDYLHKIQQDTMDHCELHPGHYYENKTLMLLLAYYYTMLHE